MNRSIDRKNPSTSLLQHLSDAGSEDVIVVDTYQAAETAKAIADRLGRSVQIKVS